jgi:hypothetical protein
MLSRVQSGQEVSSITRSNGELVKGFVSNALLAINMPRGGARQRFGMGQVS